ncbi:MAG: HD domain-containing protein [Lachnospiraceae bacterium]|nr:HD domain-containing protein [Lachnospiraceae bacterium]
MKISAGLKNRRVAHIITAMIVTFMIATLFAYLIYGEAVKEPNKEPDLSHAQYLTEWTSNIDGQNVNVTIPDSKVLTGHDNVIISTNLNNIPADYDTLLVWSKGQGVKAYLNGELFYTYDPNKADHYGANSTYLYLFIPLPENINGKQLSIQYDAVLETDAGKVGDVLIGKKASCLIQVVKSNQLELLLGLFILMVGVIELILSTVLNFIIRRDVSLFYLACSVVTLAFWIIANSRARQFIFPNASIIRDCAFLVLPLIAISFCVYMDMIQEERYHILYLIIEITSFNNFIVVAVLNYTNTVPFCDSRIGSIILLAATMVSIIVTVLYDVFKRKDKSYILVAIGLLCLVLCGIIQLVMENLMHLSVISGTAISLGLILLMIFGLLFTVKKIGQIDDDRAQAMDQVEYLSRTSMEALAKTVDAKDRYTSGHSIRVSEVSCAIAKELGWDDQQIFELRFQGMMHDIGKIGVPDTVLNKPGRLNNIEFELVQSHTTVGSEILKNVTSIPGVELVAKHHHERYDGHGYPSHLAGEDIPINARIVGIADAYDAMNSDRVYRKALPKKVIREEIIRGRGTQFDPNIVDVFIKLFDEDKLDLKEYKDSFVERKENAYDSTEFSEEVNKEINSILDDYSIEDIERVKLGELVRFLRRLRDDYYKDFHAIVFSIRPLGTIPVSEEYMAKAIDSMDVAIRKSIREVDVSCRYSKTQMLLVLFDADPNSLNLIIQRILLDYYKLFDASPLEVSYKIVDLDEEYNIGITMVE